MPRAPLTLLREVREVAGMADSANPESVSQRAFDHARASSKDHDDLPAARQIARELKLAWPEVLAVALAPEGKWGTLLDLKTRENAPHGWITPARIRYALKLVAGRLKTDSLSTFAYDEERDVILKTDARDWLHGNRLRLPSAKAIQHAAPGWRTALRIAGLKEHTPRPRGPNQTILTRVEVMDRFYAHYDEQPSENALLEFARGNKIGMEGARPDRTYPEMIEEWRQLRRDRGEPEPRVVERKGGRGYKRPDFSADVSAAKPGEYRYIGKWEDEDLCVAWVAYYLSLGGRATGRDYDAWALANPGSPTRVSFKYHGGWSVVRPKAEERLRTQGAPTGPPTPGPAPAASGGSDDSLGIPSDDTDDIGGNSDGRQDHD